MNQNQNKLLLLSALVLAILVIIMKIVGSLATYMHILNQDMANIITIMLNEAKQLLKNGEKRKNEKEFAKKTTNLLCIFFI